jgi:hypothetical protein
MMYFMNVIEIWLVYTGLLSESMTFFTEVVEHATY